MENGLIKHAIIVTSVLMLTGCATVQKLYDSYFLAPYDNVEYALVNKVRTIAELADKNCSNKQLVQADLEGMYFISVEAKNFSQYIPNNKDATKLTADLYLLTKGAYEHYQKNEKVSEVYCKAKLKQISSNAETIQRAIGARPK